MEQTNEDRRRLVAHAASAGALAFLAPISLGNAECSVELTVHNHQRRFQEAQELAVARMRATGRDQVGLPQRMHVEAAGRMGMGYVVGGHPGGSFTAADEEAFSLLMQHRPANIWLSFAAGSAAVTRPLQLLRGIIKAEDLDTHIFAQVHSAEDAVRAVSAGCDVLVLRGREAKGPSFYGGNCRESLTELFPAVAMRIERETSVRRSERSELALGSPLTQDGLVSPFILAAGGIRTGAHLRWALRMGFDGVVMGSRFEFCEESGIPDSERENELRKLTGE